MKGATKQEKMLDYAEVPSPCIRSTIGFLTYAKREIFKGDHPGIDGMLREMRGVLRKRKARRERSKK